jgi:hypothetical protein
VGIRPVAAGDRMPVVGQPGIFDQLLTDFATWSRGEDVSLPTYLKHCPCTDCFVGAAGERLRERGYGEEGGYGWLPQSN